MHAYLTKTKLQPLSNNGGTTQTKALPITSPAINAGNDAIISPGTLYDQRGPPLNRISRIRVDIDAFEYVFEVIGSMHIYDKNE